MKTLFSARPFIVLFVLMTGTALFVSSCTDPNAPNTANNKLVINGKTISTTGIAAQYYKEPQSTETIFVNYRFVTSDTTQVPAASMPSGAFPGIQFSFIPTIKPGTYTIDRIVVVNPFFEAIDDIRPLIDGSILGSANLLSHAGDKSTLTFNITENSYAVVLGKPSGRIKGTFNGIMRANSVPRERISFPEMRISGEFDLPIQ